jgi:hypothetical protein
MIPVLDDLPRLAVPPDHQASRCRPFQSYQIEQNTKNLEVGMFFIQHKLNRASRDGHSYTVMVALLLFERTITREDR